MNSEIKTPINREMKKIMYDILNSVSWLDISRRYFGKSSSWFYHKLDGLDTRGNMGGFTNDEAVQLKEALNDLADRIRKCADNIPIDNK